MQCGPRCLSRLFSFSGNKCSVSSSHVLWKNCWKMFKLQIFLYTRGENAVLSLFQPNSFISTQSHHKWLKQTQNCNSRVVKCFNWTNKQISCDSTSRSAIYGILTRIIWGQCCLKHPCLKVPSQNSSHSGSPWTKPPGSSSEALPQAVRSEKGIIWLKSGVLYQCFHL